MARLVLLSTSCPAPPGDRRWQRSGGAAQPHSLRLSRLSARCGNSRCGTSPMHPPSCSVLALGCHHQVAQATGQKGAMMVDTNDKPMCEACDSCCPTRLSNSLFQNSASHSVARTNSRELCCWTFEQYTNHSRAKDSPTHLPTPKIEKHDRQRLTATVSERQSHGTSHEQINRSSHDVTSNSEERTGRSTRRPRAYWRPTPQGGTGVCRLVPSEA